MGRRPTIAVVGQGGELPPSVESTAEELGRRVVDAGWRLATGGLGGVMAAASRGARRSSAWREGDVIGLLPGYDFEDANPWVDVAIPTGLGMARNVVLVASADVVVALAGGAGTLSELAAAWQLGRPIVALRGEGWAGALAGRAVDPRREDVVVPAEDPAEAIDRIRSLLSPGD